jgi:predicted metal-dependent phosphoesterase TrpH
MEDKRLKADFRCHSSDSNGAKSRQDAVDSYREGHYDVLLVRDRNVTALPAHLDFRGIALMPTVEYDTWLGESPHLVMFNVRETPRRRMGWR